MDGRQIDIDYWLVLADVVEAGDVDGCAPGDDVDGSVLAVPWGLPGDQRAVGRVSTQAVKLFGGQCAYRFLAP
ncbi:hypothetical protein CEY15_07630 [Dietzia natronolimnaea]|uniref:Uncharacterized protein n=1 Tax=Dietzia natronolimnaea TaxID=161920 RepID=A0A2A2WQE3_9ACTN|nr:hypothetical protein CEY15_07630 [Dietzia natronolimnaea]